LAEGMIAAARIAGMIEDRIQAEGAAADSGAVVDAVAVDVLLAALPAGAICRRQNMLRRRVPGKRAGRSAGTIVEMIAADRDRIAEDRIAGSNRADLKTDGRKIPGMAAALRGDRVSIRAKNRSCCRVNRWRNIAANRRRLPLLRWWNKNR
jgi:hypothetical protein